MARPIDDGGDPAIGLLRAKAKAAYDQARARRERVRADLAEGRVIELVEAQRQILALASSVRRALDLAPSYLPPDISPEVREAATTAMAAAIHRALLEITTQEVQQHAEAVTISA